MGWKVNEVKAPKNKKEIAEASISKNRGGIGEEEAGMDFKNIVCRYYEDLEYMEELNKMKALEIKRKVMGQNEG